jgi:aminoglycoside 6'-N-acetyltransferase I
MIRAFQPSDTQAWAKMRAQLWPGADAELEREARDFSHGLPIPTIDVVFIAENAGEYAGFLELAVRSFSDGCESMPVPHVEGWYVQANARGAGIGRSLLEAAEAWSRDRGFTELASDTEIHNVASLQAHRRCGFEEVERLIKLRKPLD